MIILGIDPGFARMGVGLIEVKNRQVVHIMHEVVETTVGEIHHKRLLTLHTRLSKILAKYTPALVAVEDLFVYKNLKTVMKVGQARGVILLTIAQHKLPIKEFTPMQIKQALTGYGKATKQQIQKMVQMELKLKEIPKPDDAADALATAIAAAHTV